MKKNEKNVTEEGQPPSEEQITALLEAFQPRPGEKFYARMETAPWNAPEQSSSGALALLRQLFSKGSAVTGPGIRIAAATAALLLAIVVVTLTSPALQALAQQIMHFFVPAPTDQLALQVTTAPPGTGEPLNAQERYPLTSKQAEELAGYSLKGISHLPDDLAFTGAHYNPSLQAVTFRYSGSGQTLLFTQRPLGDITEYSTVGASAPIEIVALIDVQGEFVAGGWRFEDPDDGIPGTSASGTQINLRVYWDSALPQRMLRWQEGQIHYEILSTKTGPGIELEKDDLIAMAESIK